MKYLLVIPPSVETVVAHLSPEIKRRLRNALEAIQEDPHLGKPLREELSGFRSFRVNRYRIVYRIHHGKIEIQVIDIALRSVIYEHVLNWLRHQQGEK